jgi:hypothetical protein
MSTQPCADYSIVNKHKSAISGTIQKRIKRKRSLDEKTENKRDKLGNSPTKSGSEDNFSDLDLQEDLATEVMAEPFSSQSTIKSEIRTEIRSAIADPEFLQMLSSAFAKQITSDLKNEIEDIKAKGEETKKEVASNKSRINKVELEIEDIKQKERCKNIIIRGVPAGNDVMKKTIDILNSKLQVNVNGSQIRYALRLGNVNGRNDRSGPVRVAFETEETRARIFKKRNKLKDSNIWISDDLTPGRSELAYKARQAVKANLIAQTWTVGGNIYTKETVNGRPRKITTQEDLPKPQEDKASNGNNEAGQSETAD